MKGRRSLAAAAAVLVALSFGSRLHADDDDAREAKARKLLQISGEAADASRMCRAGMDQKGGSLPPEYVKRFKAAADPKAFEDIFAPIYAKHFTEDDLDAMIAFYETETGKKLAKKRPKIQNEAMNAGAAWGAKTGARIMAELNKVPEDDGDDDDKPAPKKPEKKAPKPDDF